MKIDNIEHSVQFNSIDVSDFDNEKDNLMLENSLLNNREIGHPMQCAAKNSIEALTHSQAIIMDGQE